MRIPKYIVDKVYQATDIVEVIGDYVALKKKGANYWGLSPFKQERTPSFSVSPSKGIYKCFSTGKGGNAVSFLMEMEGYTYLEALKHLSKKYNIEIPEQTSEEQALNASYIESLYILNKFAASFFHSKLKDYSNSAQPLQYLEQRGITLSAIDEFLVGYNPEGWTAFTDAALKAPFPKEHLIETGLSAVSEKTGRLFDRFHGRIIFPIVDINGKTVGFGGRIIDSNPQAAKYINSPDSVVYHKSKVLFGLYQGRQAIRSKDFVILTEGYLDVISLHQAGIKQAVCAAGTAFTSEQALLIKRFASKVIILFDGDDAGQAATEKAIDILLGAHLDVSVVVLPDNHDPDSFVKAFGIDALKEKITTQPLSYVQFKIQNFKKLHPHDSPDLKIQLLHSLCSTTLNIQDEVKRAVYVNAISEALNLEQNIVETALSNAIQAQLQTLEQSQKIQQHFKESAKEESFLHHGSIFYAEREYFRLVLNYPEHMLEVDGQTVSTLDLLLNTFQVEMIETDAFKEIFLYLKQHLTEHGVFPLHNLINEASDPARAILAELLTTQHSISPNWSCVDRVAPQLDHDKLKAIQSTQKYVSLRRIEKLCNQVIQTLKTKDLPEDELIRNLKRKKFLDEQKKMISSSLGIVITR